MGIIDRIFKDKKNIGLIYILLAVGILLLSLGRMSVNSPQEMAETQINDTSLESKAEAILSEIEGVGQVRVMIFCESESRKEGVLGGSEESSSKAAKSVVIVADGAKNSAVREKIIRAAMGALGAEPHKIEVFERKESQ